MTVTSDTFRLPTRFGAFGGCYAPETLIEPLRALEASFLDARADRAFTDELARLLAEFAGRPTPLMHARRLSAELGLELWLKREDLLHTGAHKLNNALGQALLARRDGVGRVVAETGAGQHGVATAAACALLGLDCTVFMGAVDMARQRPNVERMGLFGADVVPVETGAATLCDAVSAAMRAWAEDPVCTRYVLGSALGPHPFPTLVASFHECIGREARAQLAAAAEGPADVAVACVGGGSNAIGLFRAFLDDPVELVGVEAGGRGVASGAHAARFAGGRRGVLHGAETYLLQDAEGQVLPTHSVSAGLDYPSVGPEHADLFERGRARYAAATDDAALDALRCLARTEGVLAALESSHALAWVIAEAEALAGRRVVLNLSGRGDKDLATVVAAPPAAERRAPRAETAGCDVRGADRDGPASTPADALDAVGGGESREGGQQ